MGFKVDYIVYLRERLAYTARLCALFFKRTQCKPALILSFMQ